MVKYFVSQSCSVTAAKTPGGFFLSMWVFTPGFYPDHVLDVVCVCVCVCIYVCMYCFNVFGSADSLVHRVNKKKTI